MAKIIRLLLVAILMCSCGGTGRRVEFVKYHDNGQPKPAVTVVPVWDRAEHGLAWDVGEELREGILKNLAAQSNVYVPSVNISPNDRRIDYARWGENDLTFTKNFENSDFVVLMELVDHQTNPYKRGAVQPIYPADGEVKQVLQLAMKVRVVDVRGSKPHVVLQEIIHSNHMIPPVNRGKVVDYNELTYGVPGYKNTPVGTAHTRLERDAARQVEQYVLYAQERIR